MRTWASRAAVLPFFCFVFLGAGPTSPSLPVTAGFIRAGGGAGSFSSLRAFTRIVGADALQNELQTLREKYGADDVNRFVESIDFLMNDAWKRAGQDDVKMPLPTSDSGKALLVDMREAGTSTSGAFSFGAMMDALWTPKVHAQVASDLEQRSGEDAVANVERIGTQFFKDLANV